jgi:hypothetical protein
MDKESLSKLPRRERRKHWVLEKERYLKTKYCNMFKANISCIALETCTFAHNKKELKAEKKPNTYKGNRDYKRKLCDKGKKCTRIDCMQAH